MTDQPTASAQPTRPLTLSFVLVAFRNDPTPLADLMQSLLQAAADNRVTADLIAVINDESQLVASDGVTVVQGQGNVGFAAGVKIGIARSKSDFVIIVNPDCIVDGDNLGRFIDHLKVGCGVIVPILEDASGEVDFMPYENWTYTPTRKLSEFVCRSYLRNSSSEKVPAFVKLPGAFIGMERKVAVDLNGPFDDAYFLYGEDRDLTNRLRRSPHPMRLLRDVTITHIGGESGKTVSELVERCKSDSAMRVAYRRYGRVGAIAAAIDLTAVAVVKRRRGDPSLTAPRAWAISRWRKTGFREPSALDESILAVASNESTLDAKGNHHEWRS
jgi:GT2 family glycosyltransferase